MVKKIIIAIDGPSSTGKSTLARQLADQLGYIHIDTGAMYRGVTLFALKEGFFKEGGLNIPNLIHSLDDIHIEFKNDGRSDGNKMYINAKEVESAIRSMEVSEKVSLVAQVPEVREKLMYLQRNLGRAGGGVIDGRDIGTVVFPEAELKIFLKASLSIRANRRYTELFEKNPDVSYQEVLKNLSARDQRDMQRKIAPLKKAKDAIEIDNSSLSLQEQLSLICKLAKKAIDLSK